MSKSQNRRKKKGKQFCTRAMSSLSMYLQTPKRPNLPATPVSYQNSHKTSLPPLSSILGNGEDSFPTKHTLPSLDTFATPFDKNSHGKGMDSGHYLPPQHQFRHPGHHVIQTPSKQAKRTVRINTDTNSSFENSENDISINVPETNNKPKARSSPTEAKSYAFISHSPVTFPSQEPSIDNAPLARRKRRRTSPNELSILNNEFEVGQTPNKLRRIEIAAKVSMTEKAVQIWFQNKRQSLRKQSSTEKEITELPSTSTSLITSTPMKPVLQKSESQPFVPSPSSYAIKQRSKSATPLQVAGPHASSSIVNTPMTNKSSFSTSSTPNSSFVQFDDYSTTVESVGSPSLVLNETTKKQPFSLNSDVSSTMTFKLIPAKSSTSTSPNKNNHNSSAEKDTISKVAKPKPNGTNNLQSLLNSASSTSGEKSTTTRKPLGEINVNTFNVTKSTKPAKKQTEKECIDNLLSLRGGNWK